MKRCHCLAVCVAMGFAGVISSWGSAGGDEPPGGKDSRGPAQSRPADQPHTQPAREPVEPGEPAPTSTPRPAGEVARLGRGPHRPFFGRLPEEERAEVLAFVGEYFPDEAQEFRRAWLVDPARSEVLLDRMMPELIELIRSHDQDADDVFDLRVRMFKNELKIRRTLRRYGAIPDDDRRQKVRSRVRELTAENFDLRQQLAAKEIERMETRLTRLRERLRREELDRERIIEYELRHRLEFEPRPEGRSSGDPVSPAPEPRPLPEAPPQ